MTIQWEGFKQGTWCEDIDVRNFIQKNYTAYYGNEEFLAPISTKTKAVWEKAESLII
jgi:formate C-acetyltransferase